jgi:hypothetical protein
LTQRNYPFDIEPAWGSHSAALSSALASLPPGSLVIEHGAGMCSSVLIARHDVRVVCIEEAPGWRAWAGWIYGGRAELLQRAKQATALLSSAALVLIDGAARERGDLLKWALDAGAPLIIAHDTEEPRQYGYRLDARADYVITHDGGTPRTTTWRKVTPL